MNAKSRDSKPASHQPNAAAQLHAPLARLLRPLVRLCIRSGMTFPALAQLLRELFVNVAEHDFALEGKEQTDSRVSLLPTEERGFKLSVDLDVTLPQAEDPEQAARLVAAAHQVCPYSNATRGNIDVNLTANGQAVE